MPGAVDPLVELHFQRVASASAAGLERERVAERERPTGERGQAELEETHLVDEVEEAGQRRGGAGLAAGPVDGGTGAVGAEGAVAAVCSPRATTRSPRRRSERAVWKWI